MLREFGLFVDGQSRPARDGRTYPSINPATEEPWAYAASASVEDVNDAVAAAKRAHVAGTWRNMPQVDRAAVLERIGELIMERQMELGLAEVSDSGGTMRKANIADIPFASQLFTYHGELLRTIPQEESSEEIVPTQSTNVVRREPYGVVVGIVPFNFPLCAASFKVAPAIAAGNAIVLKPSPYTPITALMLAEICTEAGVPPGIVNVITGPGPELGEALVTHRDVSMISFTGSTGVARRIMASAAPTLKKLTLECGGKSANIICKDARLGGAVRGTLFGNFFHSGQVCQSGTRVLVDRVVHDEFVERLVEATRALRVGDPMDLEMQLGPLISDKQLANVMRYISIGIEEGARCATGGRRITSLEKGYYVEPTIFTGVRNDMKIARDEIFGPVISVIPFGDEEEAIAIANDSEYGLGAAVWSEDKARARAMAERLEAGTVWINDYHLLNLRFPFGGYKQSGYGREFGPHGFAEYQQLKHVHVGEPDDEKSYAGIVVD